MKQMYKGHHGQGAMQNGPDPVTTPITTTYTDEAIASLRFMIEEEKMAGDLYDAFHDQTGLVVFSRIAAAEDRHMDALLKQAELAGMDVGDLIALPAGEYTNPALQDLYAGLLATGSVSTEAALSVGEQVELADMADLNEAMVDVAGTALVGVYSDLLAGSGNHLAVFDYFLA